MIHTGLPFYNPFLSVGGVAFNWALQTQPSPPASPPSSVTASKLSSFTIDAILGRHHQSTEGGGPMRDRRFHREERFERLAPYAPPSSTTRNISNNNSIPRTSPTSVGCSSKAKSKRVRTIFTAEQLERLEAEFAVQQYMVGPERLYLAATLQLTEAQVKVWFQNRRIKFRKAMVEQQQASLAQSPSDNNIESSNPPSPVHIDEESTSSDSFVKAEEPLEKVQDQARKTFETTTQCQGFTNLVPPQINSTSSVQCELNFSENSELKTQLTDTNQQ